MIFRQRVSVWSFATILISVFGLAGAQEAAVVDQVRTAALTSPVPVDPQITIGTFPNGLRYYIRVNKQPANRAELRLAVNAGSILEDDDQQGLAHMVEHMAFNETTHFAKQELVAFMESIGMRFGPSLNAFTSFDETVYMLRVPTDKPEVMEKAFLILEDWAQNLSFDPSEIDKERGVIVEEWRQGRGAAARMRDQQFPVLFAGSRYAERLPIGKKETIENFKHDRLKKFYTDWYRPELMAVVAVGDFDKAAVEGLLKKHFASIPKTVVPRLRPEYKLPDHPGTLYTVATDKEATMTNVSVFVKLPKHDPTTVGAYRQTLVERVFTGMFNRRMSELAQEPDPPFLGGGAGMGSFVRAADMASLSAAVKDDGVERGLETLFTEAERVARFGFTTTELERQRRELLRFYERGYAERDKQESDDLADEFVRNFTTRETIPGIAYEYALCQRFVPEIALDEVNGLAKQWTSTSNRVVMVGAPQKPGLTAPDEPKLAAAIGRAREKEIKPWVDSAADAKLIDKLPAPGKIVKTSTREAFGITEWELSNGVRVVLKPTTNKQDEIVFRATSPGGTSLASDEDFIPASSAGQIVPAGGLASFNAVALRNLLAGKVASARAIIGETEEGVAGSASPKDIETMFQLIYLTFTAPRADPTIFGVLSSQMKTVLANQKASPGFAFSEALQTTLSQNHLRARPMTAEMIDQWNLEKSFAFYKDRFADAGDFTFVFVGTFSLEVLKPLVEQYLGSLPSLHRNETWRDVGIRPPLGVIEKTVRKGVEPKSQVALVFTGPFQHDQAHRIAIRALGLVLETRLRETLREDLGGTYSVSVSPGYSKIPEQRYTFSISFGCNPQRADELVKTVFKEIDALQTDGPSERQVNDTRESFLRDYETNTRLNGYLLGQIYLKYQYGEDLADFFNLPEHYKRLNAAMIQDAARSFLKKDNYVRVTLLPEAQEQKEKEKAQQGMSARLEVAAGARR